MKVDKSVSTIVEPEMPLGEITQIIRTCSAPHIRLQHFPVEVAQAVWQDLERDPIWK